MKHPATAIFAGLLLAAATPARSQDADPEVSVQDQGASAMTGTFVGAFGKRKITICLDRVIGQTVTGYSIVVGNERAFSGSWEATSGVHIISAKEPGDHPADGTFVFTFTSEPRSIHGQWIPNDKKIGVRKFELPAREFKYNPKAGQYPQSSTKTLTEKDVENLKSEELRIMRNEIYARHGYGFKMADMREHFDKLDWYMPIAVDITTKLTPVEQKNAALLKRYENYSEEYYDSFGR
ncbi:MAG: YARHG domain-containing protein [Verrucomicrobia bacterium]|nr:YARHG domain-containing protein [Verrucomicrobiota bacterium]